MIISTNNLTSALLVIFICFYPVSPLLQNEETYLLLVIVLAHIAYVIEHMHLLKTINIP